ncbi:unnamed protein product [Protopolystoma xenopodis]|uniref:Uncharacterized protein n=1 Tax=Protopolystoma xenopodis TaxID=117903 RepID=A0A3S5FDW6_9PLAT|nr:unnamed protein product [Protopolystoma xenopodis]
MARPLSTDWPAVSRTESPNPQRKYSRRRSQLTFGKWRELTKRESIMQKSLGDRYKENLKRVEGDVFASFCVLYVMAHLIFGFWLYFDVSLLSLVSNLTFEK